MPPPVHLARVPSIAVGIAVSTALMACGLLPADDSIPIQRIDTAVGLLVSGLAESPGCFGEDHRTWYGVRMNESRQELVAQSLAGGGLQVVGVLPPLPATHPVPWWSPVAAAADGSWVVLTSRGRLVRWSPGTGSVADLLATPLGNWGCERVPGAATDTGQIALRLDRTWLLLIDRAATVRPAPIPVAGRCQFFDSACWCAGGLWDPNVSSEAGAAVRRLVPLDPPVSLHAEVAKEDAAKPTPGDAGSMPGISAILGSDRTGSVLWGLWDRHLVRIMPATGVLSVVGAAYVPATASAPATPAMHKAWVVDPEQDRLDVLTLTDPLPAASSATTTGAADAPADVMPPDPPLLSFSTLSRDTGAALPQPPRTYDLTAIWQRLRSMTQEAKDHPFGANQSLLLSHEILGIGGGMMAVQLDCEIRYGFVGMDYMAILVLPTDHFVGGAVPPFLVAIVPHVSSGVGGPITEYPLTTTDPGRAVCVQYHDSALLLPWGLPRTDVHPQSGTLAPP